MRRQGPQGETPNQPHRYPPAVSVGLIWLGYLTGLIGPYTRRMGNTKLPPLQRFMAWLEARRSLCIHCRHMPAITNGFCSDDCELAEVERQAIA